MCNITFTIYIYIYIYIFINGVVREITVKIDNIGIDFYKDKWELNTILLKMIVSWLQKMKETYRNWQRGLTLFICQIHQLQIYVKKTKVMVLKKKSMMSSHPFQIMPLHIPFFHIRQSLKSELPSISYISSTSSISFTLCTHPQLIHQDTSTGLLFIPASNIQYEEKRTNIFINNEKKKN